MAAAKEKFNIQYSTADNQSFKWFSRIQVQDPTSNGCRLLDIEMDSAGTRSGTARNRPRLGRAVGTWRASAADLELMETLIREATESLPDDRADGDPGRGAGQSSVVVGQWQSIAELVRRDVTAGEPVEPALDAGRESALTPVSWWLPLVAGPRLSRLDR
jgi:hypothetical protein